MFQDEYLEWSVRRVSWNVEGDVLSVSMMCEGPEYWQFYASYEQEKFISTIRQLHPGIRMEETKFFLTDPSTGAKVYKPNNNYNVWSTTGTIIHLIQPNNTLSAEIDIAAQGTSKYGNPGRNSDPVIGGNINAIARSGKTMCVADPIALYIHSFDTSSFVYDIKSTSGKPKKEHLKEIEDKDKVFVVQRGDINKKFGLRIKVEVPAGVKGIDGQQLNVSSIFDKNTMQHVRFGAQFAYINIGVTVVIKDGKAADADACFNPGGKGAALHEDAVTGAVPVGRY